MRVADIVWTKHRNSNGSIDYTAPLASPVRCYDGIANAVQIWYNFTTRDWVCMLVSDAETRYQRGPSEYMYTRAEAEAFAGVLITESEDN